VGKSKFDAQLENDELVAMMRQRTVLKSVEAARKLDAYQTALDGCRAGVVGCMEALETAHKEFVEQVAIDNQAA
jgi:hypothetical protein